MTYTPSPYEFTGWLALRRSSRYSGNDLLARLLTNRPALDSDEIAVKVTVKVPRSAFTAPTLEATITVPEQAVLHPEVEIEGPGE